MLVQPVGLRGIECSPGKATVESLLRGDIPLGFGIAISIAKVRLAALSMLFFRSSIFLAEREIGEVF